MKKVNFLSRDQVSLLALFSLESAAKVYIQNISRENINYNTIYFRIEVYVQQVKLLWTPRARDDG